MKLTIILNVLETNVDLPPQFACLDYLELAKASIQQPRENSALPITGNISLPDGQSVGEWRIEP
jgi:hypothetical protein